MGGENLIFAKKIPLRVKNDGVRYLNIFYRRETASGRSSPLPASEIG